MLDQTEKVGASGRHGTPHAEGVSPGLTPSEDVEHPQSASCAAEHPGHHSCCSWGHPLDERVAPTLHLLNMARFQLQPLVLPQPSHT